MGLPHSAEAKRFYNSKSWRDCRLHYLAKMNYICERCNDAANIVHHKIYIDSNNINDVNVTLNHDNLEAICHTCHNREHFASEDVTREDVSFDMYGQLIARGTEIN